MSKLRVGIIGTGGIAEIHMNSYAANPDVELYAICDLVEERAAKKAEQRGISRIYTDFRQMLNDPQLDAISICTPNSAHAPISIAALQAGKHVLVEKPLCITVEEALEVEKAVRASNCVLQVGFVRRYGNNTKLVKRFIEAGEIGEVYYAKASCLRKIGNPGGWFSDQKRSGGGPLIDLGVHVIDLCWYLMGRPKVKSVSGNTYKKLGNRANIQNLAYYKCSDYDPDKNDVEDLANAMIRFENGASLLVDVSFSLHAKQDEITAKIYGEKGGAELEPELMLVSEKHDTILNITPQVDNLAFDGIQSFANEINHFVDSCLGRIQTLSPVEDGVEMMKILCGIYESARIGREIHFEGE
ncbi:Gfo/Idh/MocA family protein [Paenibacillus sp. GCM10027626]|uniref:Gfo/Idh/MocA family protein n=1 Tax=Paenibacillus sp. GCM10027626 TaxID=3273411 RepID=UPI003645453B